MKSKNKYTIIFVLLVSSIIIHYAWFIPKNIFTSGDWVYIPFKKYIDFGKFNPIWVSQNFGTVSSVPQFYVVRYFEGLMSRFLYFNFAFNEKIFFLIPVAILPLFSTYVLLRKFTDRISAVIGALFFSFNTAYLLNQTGALTIAVGYSLCPLILSTFISFIKQEINKLYKLFFLSFLVSISFFYETRITIITCLICFIWLMFLFYPSFFGNILSNARRIIPRLVVLFIIIVTIQFFWVFPFIFSPGTNSSVGELVTRNLFNSQISLIDALTIHHPYWTGARPEAFVSHPISLYFWIIPILIFLCPFFYKHIKRRSLQYYFFAILIALFGILLTKQGDIPFNSLYAYLFNHVPGFSLYRESSKFFLIITLSYSILLAIFIQQWKNFLLKNKFRNTKVLSIIPNLFIITVIILNIYPLISGKFATLITVRNVPSDYILLSKDIFSNNQNFRTLWIPKDSRWAPYNDLNPKVSLIDVLDREFKDLRFFEKGSTLFGKLKSTLTKNYLDAIFDMGSVKYVVVPIQDFANEDDFFVHYGGDQNPDIREWYIDQLDNLPWLKKIEIGTKNLVVYENYNFKNPVFTFNDLYSFDTLNLLDKKYNVVNFFNNDFSFVYDAHPNLATNSPLIFVSNIFESLSQNNLINGNIISSKKIQYGSNNQVLLNKNSLDIFALRKNKKIYIYQKSDGRFSVNDKLVDGIKKIVTSSLGEADVPVGKKVYISEGPRLVAVKNEDEISLGHVDAGSEIRVFNINRNLVNNGSFEYGPWQETVGDCNNYDDNGLLRMGLNKYEKNDGKQSLQLEATRHIACTSSRINIKDSGDYILSFDFQSPNAKRAGFFISFNDDEKTIINQQVAISGARWQSVARIIHVPFGATVASLYLYAYSTDGKTNIINRYDDISFGKLEKISNNIFSGKNIFDLVTNDLEYNENVFKYSDGKYSYANQFDNGSFENGLWQEDVGDCNRYDKVSILSMELNANEKTEGKQSLQLEATKHNACTTESMPVVSGASYMLSFDYQSPNTKSANYYIGFDDSKKTSITEIIPITDRLWHGFTKIITVPDDATSLSLFVYANETDGKTNIINRYDNFKLIEIPDLSDSYYLVSEPKEKLVEPKDVEYDLINPTKKMVHVKGATTGFFVGMSESYHDQWQLQLNNNNIHGWLNGWWPFAKPDRIADEYHYKLDGFLNAWYVVPKVWCEDGKNTACKKNDDGSWNIEMVAEFWPQRWFYLGLLISGTTLVGCLGYLGYVGGRSVRRRIKARKEKKYAEEAVK